MNKSQRALTRRQFVVWTGALAGAQLSTAVGDDLAGIASQPYFASVKRALEALEKLGSPVAAEDARQLAKLASQADSSAISASERILERYTLMRIAVEPDDYARLTVGSAQRTLIEQGWRVFLLRISNPTGMTRRLHVLGPTPMWTRTNSGLPRVEPIDPWNTSRYLAQAWLMAQLYEAAPLAPDLSGFAIEYKVIQLYSRDRGHRSQSFDVVTTDAWHASLAAMFQYRRGTKLDFDCLPSHQVSLRVRDADGQSCVASILIKDRFNRVYPAQAMRLAPDMQFQPQIYRADGESVRLPAGEYVIESRRGPEYLPRLQTARIGTGENEIAIDLTRWIDPAQWNWYSGDVHIHAAGCAHYQRPTEGVAPETMIRQVRGEGLSIGDVLTWGPSWYYQKQFFTGRAESPPAALEHPQLQAANNTQLQPRPTAKDRESLLRYDVEVSGFPSSHCGHLILLRLKEQDYPGTKLIEEWPSWNLPVLQWARTQGAVVGYAHCGLGMVVASTELPNFEIPPMDGIGTQEAIVDITHDAVDFLSGCNTVPIAELNAWYHMLNCGFRLSLVGETDYPCVTDERPGVGRTYVRLDRRPVDDAGFETWVRSLQQGKLYCGDGRSHFLDFNVSGRRCGEEDLLLKAAGPIEIEALVAARLEPQVPDLQQIKRTFLNGWHLENARIGATREVPVELIVNGYPVSRTTILADGTPTRLNFRTSMVRSSWVALRILPSSHTYPVFVQVSGKPIRASRRSAQWCRSCIDKIWEVKAPFMRDRERPEAARAFDHARSTYERIARECEVE